MYGKCPLGGANGVCIVHLCMPIQASEFMYKLWCHCGPLCQFPDNPVYLFIAVFICDLFFITSHLCFHFPISSPFHREPSVSRPQKERPYSSPFAPRPLQYTGWPRKYHVLSRGILDNTAALHYWSNLNLNATRSLHLPPFVDFWLPSQVNKVKYFFSAIDRQRNLRRRTTQAIYIE